MLQTAFWPSCMNRTSVLSGIRDSRKAGSLWGMMRGVRKSIRQSWLAKGLSYTVVHPFQSIRFIIKEFLLYYKFGSAFCGHWFDLQWMRSLYTLLKRTNNDRKAVQWFCMSHAVLAGFFGQGNSIYDIIPLLWKMYLKSISALFFFQLRKETSNLVLDKNVSISIFLSLFGYKRFGGAKWSCREGLQQVLILTLSMFTVFVDCSNLFVTQILYSWLTNSLTQYSHTAHQFLLW